MRLVRWTAWVLVGLLLAAVGGYAGWQTMHAPATPTAQSVAQASVRSEFELVDHRGKVVTEADYADRWQLVFFGFTHCPDVCPTTLSMMARVLDLLGIDADRIAPLFITVDPERDTPPVLAEYVSAFHPGIVGLTGTAEQVRAAAASFRVFFGRETDQAAPDGYMMSHSGYIYLMRPSGVYEAVFSEHRDEPELIAAAIRQRFAGVQG